MTNKQKTSLFCLLYSSLLCILLTAEGESCSNGFTSIERMGAVLGQYDTNSIVERFKDTNVQILVPGSNFSCSGRILSWVFGAQWREQSPQFTELQIWRPSGERSYTKISATNITTEENQTRLYRYQLSPPLEYQTGDILGFYQGRDSETLLTLLYETTESGPLAFTSRQDLPAAESFVTVEDEDISEHTDFHAMIGVETDAVGCENGFMSQERMRILLGLDHVKKSVGRDQRQQITPHVNFTCGGLITGWVVSGEWRSDDNRFPEVQIWRRIDNQTMLYRKVNGTFLSVGSRSNSMIYEYRDFEPIPFEPGDVVGMFIPKDSLSRLRLRAEDDGSTLNYYVMVKTADSESPVEEIDLDETEDLQTEQYLPLVSAYITQTDTTGPDSISSTTTISITPPSIDVAVRPTPKEPNRDSAGDGVGTDLLLVAIVIVAVIGSTCIGATLLVSVGIAVSLKRNRKTKLTASNCECTQIEGGGVYDVATLGVPVMGASIDQSELSGEYRKFDNPLYNTPTQHVYESVP